MLTDADRLRHRLSGEFARESVAYCAIVPDERSVYLLYAWVDAADVAGYAFAIYRADGPEPAYFARREGIPAAGQDFDDWHVGGLHVRVGEDFTRAEVTYADDEYRVELTFEAIHDAFDYGSNVTGCPPYQATNRYEQGGVIRGTLERNGMIVEFDGPGHRDHSWGRRDWSAIHHYKWLSIVGEDRAANIMVALVEGETLYNGYIFRDGLLSGIVRADIETGYSADRFQDAITVVALDEAGRSTTLEFPERFASARWDYSPTVNFTDTGMTGTLHGGVVHAYIQYVWPCAYLDRMLAAAAVGR
ncbi:MAG TPA: hypothetical protein VJU58_16670 [Microbacterium sp.]|nr:hypothetical protein [Microbacterium sp.]